MRITQKFPRTIAFAYCFVFCTAALCTPPETTTAQFLKRVDESITVSQWLTDLSPHLTPQSMRVSVHPIASHPVTSGEYIRAFGEMELQYSIECDSAVCTGSISGGGVSPQGIRLYEYAGTWDRNGAPSDATVYIEYEDGMSFALRLSPSGKNGILRFGLDQQEQVEFQMDASYITRTTQYAPIVDCLIRNAAGREFASCDDQSLVIQESPFAVTNVPWAVPSTETLTSTTHTFQYQEKDFIASNIKGLGEYTMFGVTPFGASSDAFVCASQATCSANWTYPSLNVYTARTDTARVSSGGFEYARYITTYNPYKYKLIGESSTAAENRINLSASIEMDRLNILGEPEPFVAQGAFEYKEHPTGFKAEWTGVLQQADGSAMFLKLLRKAWGHWTVSGSYDFAPSPQYPDEIFDYSFLGDGSGFGSAQILELEDEDDPESILVYDTEIVFPQPGARLTSAD